MRGGVVTLFGILERGRRVKCMTHSMVTLITRNGPLIIDPPCKRIHTRNNFSTINYNENRSWSQTLVLKCTSLIIIHVVEKTIMRIMCYSITNTSSITVYNGPSNKPSHLCVYDRRPLCN